jgi:serine/threonine protein kinase
MANPAAQHPRFLAPGDKLGKYELIRQIAVGGMAELYLARTVGIEGFEKLVVVKRILPQFAHNASFVNMFLNEARLAATLHHPNIAQVYDIGQEGTDYFFAMEYIHGEDLGRMVATAADSGVPISLDVALTLTAGLCAGLHYAHEKVASDGRALNVVHRDVSPSNVLVSYDGAVKLVDFGIARAGSQPSTTRGGLKGKIGYMSPEQCKGKEMLDRRSDIFSIGALLYELTTGRLPFVDETEYGVLNQIVNTDAPPPSKFVPSFPPALEKIVLKALSRDRSQRYASAIELQGDIEDFAHENRLRISPLVLARMMGSLFPARLEEWDSARAQGAFFVEQHVVRTLIESGKTGDSGLAYLPQRTQVQDEDTSISPPPAMPDNEPTNVQTRPITPPAPLPRAPTPPVAQRPVTPHPAPPAVQRTPTPVPPARMATPIPNAVPIVAPPPTRAASAPGGGVLVSSTGNFGARATPVPVPAAQVLSVGDTTERVRVPTSPSSDASLLAAESRSRMPLILLAAAGAIGLVVAIVIIVSGGDAPEKAAAETAPPPSSTENVEKVEAPAVVKEEPEPEPEPVKEEPKAAVKEAVKAEPVEPEVAKTEPAPKPKAEPKPKAPPKKVAKEPKKIVKAEAKKPPKAEVKKDPPPKPEPPEPKPEAKEPAKWNADSPFMPVREKK